MTFTFQMDHIGDPDEREKVLFDIAETFKRYLRNYHYTSLFVDDIDGTINIHFVNANKL